MKFLYDYSDMEPLAPTEGQLALFPKKPARSAGAAGKPLKLYSNYFKIDFDSKDIQGVNKYTLKFEPEIPDNSRKTRKEILRVVRDDSCISLQRRGVRVEAATARGAHVPPL